MIKTQVVNFLEPFSLGARQLRQTASQIVNVDDLVERQVCRSGCISEDTERRQVWLCHKPVVVNSFFVTHGDSLAAEFEQIKTFETSEGDQLVNYYSRQLSWAVKRNKNLTCSKLAWTLENTGRSTSFDTELEELFGFFIIYLL